MERQSAHQRGREGRVCPLGWLNLAELPEILLRKKDEKDLSIFRSQRLGEKFVVSLKNSLKINREEMKKFHRQGLMPPDFGAPDCNLQSVLS